MIETNEIPTDDETTAPPDAPTPTGSGQGSGDAVPGAGEDWMAGDADAPSLAPDAYALTPPDGVTLDEETLALATPVFRDLNLSNDQAQSLMPVAAEFARRAGAAAIATHQIDQARAFSAMTREWADNAKGDVEIGGVNWDRTMELSGKALDMLGFPCGSGFRTMLNDSGFGNHPELIRAFRRIGERLSEDAFETGGGAAQAPRSMADRWYKQEGTE